MHEFSECDILGVLLALVLDRRQRKLVVFRLDLVGLRLLVVLRVLDLFRIASGLGVFDALRTGRISRPGFALTFHSDFPPFNRRMRP